MNSHPDRSLGSIPAGRKRQRFHPKISPWKPYLPFSHCLQYFRSRRMRRRRDLQTHPSGPPPRPTQQPCPGEGQLHSDPSAPPVRAQHGAVCWGPAPLPAPAGIGSAGKRVTVRELFKPQCLGKCGFNFKPLGFVAALFIHVYFFPLAPLEYTTMISSLSFGEYIYIFHIFS